MATQSNNVVVRWDNQHNKWWNETCASVVEVFGLPGSRFTYHPTSDFMEFRFSTSQDAELCRILLSEKL